MGKDPNSGQTPVQGLMFLDYRCGRREACDHLSLYMSVTVHMVVGGGEEQVYLIVET